MLTPAERRTLILIARNAALSALGLRGTGTVPELSPSLLAPGAAFVTWRREGRLRGCIGSFEPHRPLSEDVRENALAALLRDPRFPPATAKDFPRYEVEISVLGPLEPLTSPGEIEIGHHGLFVSKGVRSGLLLPQVATEWGFGAEKFLEQVCLKAGLPPDAWQAQKGASLFKFTAEIFSQDILAAPE